MQETLNEIRAYLLGIWRRRWVGMIACWVVGILGALFVFTTPNNYKSNATIYVDTKNPLWTMMKKDTIQGDITSEVAMMKETLLSRPNLRKVARATDMEYDVETPLEMDNLIKSLGKRTSIKIEGDDLYQIAFTDTDPVLAKEVVQALITIFIEKNQGQNNQEMNDTRVFIEEQLANFKKELTEAEKRIADFRAENAAVVGPSNYAERLQSTQNQILNFELEYDDLAGLAEQLQQQLAETDQFVEMASQTIVIGDGSTSGMGRINALQAELDELRLNYTENHPDVIAKRRQLNIAVARYNSGGDFSGGMKTEVPSPIYENLSLKLLETETAARQLKRKLEKAEAQLQQLNEYATIAPALDQELAQLTRELDIARTGYENMLAQKQTIEITEAMKNEVDSVSFRIIEPPEVPTKPVAPDRMLYLSAALALAIAAGIGCAFVRSQVEESFFEPKGLEKALNIPVLGVVTNVPSPEQLERTRRNNLGFMFATASFFILFGGLFITLALLQTPSVDVTTVSLL